VPKDWAPGEVLGSTDLDTYMLQPGTTGTGTRLVAGSTNIVFSSSASASGVISFGFTFSAAPKVVAVVQIGSNFDVAINFTGTPTTTQVGVRLFQVGGVSISGTAHRRPRPPDRPRR
jgi:hypothetical protein